MLLNRTVAGINLWNIANGLLNKKSLEHRIDMMKRKPSSRSKAWKAVTIPLAAVLFLILTASVVYDTNEQIIAPKPIKPISSLLAEASGDDKTTFVIPSDLSVLTGISKYAPKGYLCGYVVTEPAGNISYGLFLVKNRKRYELVLKWSYKTETRRIYSDLANALLGSAEANLDNATDEKPVAGDRGNETGIKLVDFYDGNKVYVLMPDKAAEYRSEEIPDKIWLEQYRSLTNSQEQVASESKK